MTANDQILTTHVGSLPRPHELLDAFGIFGNPAPPEQIPGMIAEAVQGVVDMQVGAGIDIVSDGEMSKPGYSTYMTERMSGFGGAGHPLSMQQDILEFPDWGASLVENLEKLPTPACIGDVSYDNTMFVEGDIANFTKALSKHKNVTGFVPAASPGVIAMFLENQHYKTHQEYVMALATAMKTEYDAIHKAGYILQLDCPDLAVGRHVQFSKLSEKEWRTTIEASVHALNMATADIPPEAMRMHICWGNYEGPHNHDVPFKEIVDLVLSARPSGILFEGANPRHEHEWHLWEDQKLPDGKVLIPGVIDSTSNYVEHPDFVAERISRYANLVGRENVIAGTDCGFGTFAAYSPVFPSVVAAKLKTLVEGAQIASKQLWGKK
jgi:5-methyltetrahydropteroyltriglutamate--homocysteine methyltransferase